MAGLDLGVFGNTVTQSLVSNMGKSSPFSWLTNNANELKGVGTLLGGLGQVYGTYNQAKISDKINKLNFSIYADAKKRREDADNSLKLGFANSTFGKGA